MAAKATGDPRLGLARRRNASSSAGNAAGWTGRPMNSSASCLGTSVLVAQGSEGGRPMASCSTVALVGIC